MQIICDWHSRPNFRDGQTKMSVWHQKTHYTDLGLLVIDDEYKWVADLSVDCFEQAFTITQSLENYWGKNDGVLQCLDQQRSTSVGDLVISENDLLIKQVDGIGWIDIDLEKVR